MSFGHRLFRDFQLSIVRRAYFIRETVPRKRIASKKIEYTGEKPKITGIDPNIEESYVMSKPPFAGVVPFIPCHHTKMHHNSGNYARRKTEGMPVCNIDFLADSGSRVALRGTLPYKMLCV